MLGSIRYIECVSSFIHMFQFSPDIEVNVDYFGAGKRTLVCLHGFGASSQTWTDIKPFLQTFGNCFALDLKGFGLSSKPRDGHYSLRDQAEIVVSLITKMRLSKITLIGHSYGGAVALLAYFDLVERGLKDLVESIVLIDSGGYLQRLPFQVAIPRTPVLNTLLVRWTPVRWQVIFTLKRLFFDQTKITQERIERYAKFLRLPGSQQALISAAEQVIPENPQDVIDRIRELSAPTLIIWGRNDRVIPLEHAFRFHEDIPNSELKVIDNCGHIPQEEKPSETADAIERFLMRGE
jgi:pimeloyl-ACP methyl ester carboxylesterase